MSFISGMKDKVVDKRERNVLHMRDERQSG